MPLAPPLAPLAPLKEPQRASTTSRPSPAAPAAPLHPDPPEDQGLGSSWATSAPMPRATSRSQNYPPLPQGAQQSAPGRAPLAPPSASLHNPAPLALPRRPTAGRPGKVPPGRGRPGPPPPLQ